MQKVTAFWISKKWEIKCSQWVKVPLCSMMLWCKLNLLICSFRSSTKKTQQLQGDTTTPYLIFQREGKAVLKKAGCGHRTQCSEIWTASVTDLSTWRGVSHGYQRARLCSQTRTNHYTLTVAHSQQVVFPSSIKRILGKKKRERAVRWRILGQAFPRSCHLFTDFQVETFSSTKENILSHWSRGRQSRTSPSRTKGVVAEQMPAWKGAKGKQSSS